MCTLQLAAPAIIPTHTPCRPPSSSGQRSRAGPDRALSSSRAAAHAEPALAEDAAAGGGEGQQIGSTPHRPIQVLNRYRALLLDSTYRPVGVANWQR